MNDAPTRGRSGVVTQVRAEWIKFRTLRSTWITLAIVIVAAILPQAWRLLGGRAE